MNPKKFLKSFWGGAIVVLTIILLIYFFGNFFKKGEVAFDILGPNDVRAGEVQEFRLIYSNNSKTILERAEIEIKLAEGVMAIDAPDKETIIFPLEEILVGSSKEQKISLVFFGEIQNLKNIEAIFRYKPKNISSLFAKKSVKSVFISGSPFSLDLNIPSEIFIGQNFPFEIKWENLTNQIFEGVELIADWPSGFSFESANPDVSKEKGESNKWILGILNPASQGKINVRASIFGEEGEAKRIILTLGLARKNKFLFLARSESFVTLTSNPLKITGFVNESVNQTADLGESLDFVINFQNNYSSSLRDLKIKTEFKGDVFDFNTLRAPRGLFSSRLKTITWTGSQVPELYLLNPQESGLIRFSIKLKKDWPMLSAGQKNIVMEAKTTIESGSIPEQLRYQEIPQAEIINTIKLNTDCRLILESYFRDAPSKIVNAGKLPLRIDEPTEFTIHWKILNTYNAVNDVVITAGLPLWVEFTGKVSGNYGNNSPVYNSSNRQITWTIPTVPDASGILTKPYEAIFQIKITPLSSHLYQAVELVGETTFSAVDAFTGKNINFSLPSLLSNKLTDKTVLPDDGIVKP